MMRNASFSFATNVGSHNRLVFDYETIRNSSSSPLTNIVYFGPLCIAVIRLIVAKTSTSGSYANDSSNANFEIENVKVDIQ